MTNTRTLSLTLRADLRRQRVLVALACAMLGATIVATPAFAQGRTDIEEKLDRLKMREPIVEEVQQRSLEFFRVDNGRVNGMRAGAAWKAAVPWVEFTGGATGAGINETTLLDEYQPIENDLPWVKRNANGQAFEGKARLSWNLPNLLFNPEELDVSSLMMAQKDVINTVTQLYYERRRVQVQLLAAPPRDPVARIQLEMRIEELTARLSGLTGGWFQEALDAGLRPKG